MSKKEITIDEYYEGVLRTKSDGYYIERVNADLAHGVDGIVTEAGELLDQLKKVKYYGKDLDLVNLQEEIGDLMYYIFVCLHGIANDSNVKVDELFNDILIQNNQKLKARYGDKFTTDAAINRDLDNERKVLEQNAT